MSHKVFVSYHHKIDQLKAKWIKDNYGSDVFIDRSLEAAFEGLGDEEILSSIRTHNLKDSSVTVVLVGSETANRKWVDWEINASLRPYGSRTRNGLLAIYLDDSYAAPARLQDNIDSGYAVTMKWQNISWQLEDKIEEAYNNRFREELVRNSRPLRRHNS